MVGSASLKFIAARSGTYVFGCAFLLCIGVNDVEQHFPGAIDKIRSWYQKYKTADGKEENSYAFGGKPVDRQQALKIVDECHQEWLGSKKPQK
jgi:hypothetical protein